PYSLKLCTTQSPTDDRTSICFISLFSSVDMEPQADDTTDFKAYKYSSQTCRCNGHEQNHEESKNTAIGRAKYRQLISVFCIQQACIDSGQRRQHRNGKQYQSNKQIGLVT